MSMRSVLTPRALATTIAIALGAIGTAAAQDHSGHVMPAVQEATRDNDADAPSHDHAHGHAAPEAPARAHHPGHAVPPVTPTAPTQAVDHSQRDHSGMDHAGMDHSGMDHSGMDSSRRPASQPREPIPPVTEADRAAAFPALRHHMEHAPGFNTYVLFNRLEATDGDHGRGQAWEAQAWFGGDIHRLWLRSEGERAGGDIESADLEVLYGRSVTPWWDVVAGIRHDVEPGPSRTWAAVGVQGLAPYMFEVSATGYLGESGRTAANVELEYEVLFTNRLILQPLVELEFHGKDDPARGIGSGLSKAEAGLRLRYEVRREFAPYVGIVRERRFGRTADYHRAEGEPVDDTKLVAGVRFWF